MKILDKVKTNFSKRTTIEDDCQNDSCSQERDYKKAADILSQFADQFSENKMFDKIKSVAKKAGINVIYPVTVLFSVLKSKEVSLKEKSAIAGALGYFILPVDFVPDALPVVGFTDDLAAIMLILNMVSYCISAQINMDAKLQLHKWFGDFNDQDIQLDLSNNNWATKFLSFFKQSNALK